MSNSSSNPSGYQALTDLVSLLQTSRTSNLCPTSGLPRLSPESLSRLLDQLLLRCLWVIRCYHPERLQTQHLLLAWDLRTRLQTNREENREGDLAMPPHSQGWRPFPD